MELQKDLTKLRKELNDTTAKEVRINFYGCRRPFGEFSNFFPAALWLDGVSWPSSEHFYQAQKFIHDKVHMDKIRKTKSPATAKQLGLSTRGPKFERTGKT
jgi:ribA/ribD-fused uncharacterized protein